MASRLFSLLLLTSLAFGILARTFNLEAKPYWLDESYTLLRTSGHTAEEVTRHLWQGRLLPVSALLRYQHPSPHDGGAAGTIAGLAWEEPQLPPLYFLLARTWQQWLMACMGLPLLIVDLTMGGRRTTNERYFLLLYLLLHLGSLPVAGWRTLLRAERSGRHLVGVVPVRHRDRPSDQCAPSPPGDRGWVFRRHRPPRP